MNNFMPSNLTSALYNQVTSNHKSDYNYDINISGVNKSLNEYEPTGPPAKSHQGMYYGPGNKQDQ